MPKDQTTCFRSRKQKIRATANLIIAQMMRESVVQIPAVSDKDCDLYPMIRTWWIHLSDGVLKGKTQQNFLSVFNYLDDVLTNIKNIR